MGHVKDNVPASFRVKRLKDALSTPSIHKDDQELCKYWPCQTVRTVNDDTTAQAMPIGSNNTAVDG